VLLFLTKQAAAAAAAAANHTRAAAGVRRRTPGFCWSAGFCWGSASQGQRSFLHQQASPSDRDEKRALRKTGLLTSDPRLRDTINQIRQFNRDASDPVVMDQKLFK
ncbi:hypothetical protein CRUP_024902, partial [Coryphaenoides rupestris]